MLLAASEFTPLKIAALFAWMLSVCLHEFSHALVGYWGSERHGRGKRPTFDPASYIDPIFSLLIPAFVLMAGGFPLPGGSVMVDRSRLRSSRWESYVSAAGPASNLILFLLLTFPLHPKLHLVDASAIQQPTWVYFLGCMAFLNFIATLFNLIPVPPLDGFGMIEPKLDPEVRWKLRQPHVTLICFGAVFLLFATVDSAMLPFVWMLETVCARLGLPTDLIFRGYSIVMFDYDPVAAN